MSGSGVRLPTCGCCGHPSGKPERRGRWWAGRGGAGRLGSNSHARRTRARSHLSLAERKHTTPRYAFLVQPFPPAHTPANPTTPSRIHPDFPHTHHGTFTTHKAEWGKQFLMSCDKDYHNEERATHLHSCSCFVLTQNDQTKEIPGWHDCAGVLTSARRTVQVYTPPSFGLLRPRYGQQLGQAGNFRLCMGCARATGNT